MLSKKINGLETNGKLSPTKEYWFDAIVLYFQKPFLPSLKLTGIFSLEPLKLGE